jgi:hypothetical protein
MKKAIIGLIFIVVALSSCTKNIEEVQPKVASVPQTIATLMSFLDSNVKKTPGDGDPTWYYWTTTKISIDSQTVILPTSIYGIWYKLNPMPENFPTIYQLSTGGHFRTIALGNKSQLCPAFYKEFSYTVALTITTSDGKKFTWDDCPIVVSYKYDNSGNYHWTGNEEVTKIVVDVVSKTK